MKKVQKIPFKKFKEIYSRVPRLCVEVVLVQNGSLLLIKRTIEPAKGEWHTPGGTVLKGEDLEQAVMRVAKEELAVKVTVDRFIGVIEYKSYKNHYSQDISLAFLVKTKNTRFDLDGHADEFGFFTKIPTHTIKEQKEFYSKVLGFKIERE
jgi:ADP-ribose pyrophosphatase YjhB (NUDIX family)